MTKFFLSFLLILFLFFFYAAFAQSGADSGINKTDSLNRQQKSPSQKDSNAKTTVTQADTLLLLKDSLSAKKEDSLFRKMPITAAPSALSLYKYALSHNPWFNFSGTPQVNFMEEHIPASEEGSFYLLISVVLYFALIKIFFAKYLDNLISLFLRASMRQQQLREQLLQTPLPSLLLNLLFVITGGLYICFLARYYQLATGVSFWLLSIDCCVLLGVVYSVKFLVLKMTGWVFNVAKAADTYIFIVFMINKMLGILLIPFLIVLFFSEPTIREIALVISFCLTGFLFLYRFIASYPSIRNEIKISIFYFFLYLCAFEIAPLLLIYKVLLTYLEKAY